MQETQASSTSEQTGGEGADESASSGEEEPLLRVDNLKTHFHTDEGTVRAVDGVSWTIDRGESLGIVGESGSGKSVSQISVLKLIPTPPGEIVDGRILFDGEDLLEKSEEEIRQLRGNRISMIWQDPMSSLNPFLRVSTQLLEPLQIHRDLTEAEEREQAIEMLSKVGIPDAENRFDEHPHQFSGGMRQRVMIAMALLCRPDLLIADEPTTALDVTIQAQILDLLNDLKQDFNTSIALITHDLGVVAGMADRIVVMYGGRVMEEAPAERLFRQPAHPYTVGLLKSVPRVDQGRSKKLIPIEGQPPDATEETPGCPFAERCRWAVDKCEEEFPPAVEVEPDRRSHCWRAEEVHAARLGSRADSEHVEEVETRIEDNGEIQPGEFDELVERDPRDGPEETGAEEEEAEDEEPEVTADGADE